MLAVAAGAVLFASQQPVGAGWLGLVAVAPLAALARDIGRGPRPFRTGLGWGTLAGLCFYVPFIEWIRHIGEVVALPLLASFMALHVGLFVAGVAVWGERPAEATAWRARLARGWWRPGFVAVWWVVLEAVRGAFPLGGFPWGMLGYSQATGGLLLTAARGIGVVGVTFLCAAIGAAVEEAVHRALLARQGVEGAGGDAEAVFAGLRVPLAAILGLMVAGILIGGDPPEPTGETLDVAGVQGFAEDSTGESPGRAMRMADGMLETTARMIADGGVPELTVWPEAAINGDPRVTPELADAIDEAMVMLDGGPLITGVDFVADEQRFHRTLSLYEGVDVAAAEDEPQDAYAKRKLVPFGEYVPLRSALEWFPPLQRTPRDAVPGDRWAVFDVGGAMVAPLICFDVVSGPFAQEAVTDGAQLIVVGTMNASYGVSGMSDQHLAFSQLRAVETGRHVVHAAVTGISGMVAPDGTVTQRTGHYEQAIIRDDVPLVDSQTLATRLGRAPLILIVTAAVAGIGIRGAAGLRARGRAAMPSPR